MIPITSSIDERLNHICFNVLHTKGHLKTHFQMKTAVDFSPFQLDLTFCQWGLPCYLFFLLKNSLSIQSIKSDT